MRLIPIFTPDSPSFIQVRYVKPALVTLDNSGLLAVSTMPLKFDHEHNLLKLSYDERLVEEGLINKNDQDSVAPFLGITKIILDVLGRAVVIDVSKMAMFTFRDEKISGHQAIRGAVVEYSIPLNQIFAFVDQKDPSSVKVKITCEGRIDLLEGFFKVEAVWEVQDIDLVPETMKKALWESFKPVGFDIFANRTAHHRANQQ